MLPGALFAPAHECREERLLSPPPLEAGVFFIYDISPIMVTFREERPAFSYFLTSLCAIVGGVFTVAGIVDSCIYSASGGPGLKM